MWGTLVSRDENLNAEKLSVTKGYLGGKGDCEGRSWKY